MSAAASGAVGIAASEAGLGGFVSTLAASLAGAYVNSEVMPQKDFSNNPNWKPTGLGSTGTLEYNRDGKEFKAISIDYNSAEFHKTIDAVKVRIYGECLEQGLPTKQAVEAAHEIEEFLEKTDVKECCEKLNQAGAKQKRAQEIIARLEAEDPRLKARMDGAQAKPAAAQVKESAQVEASPEQKTAKVLHHLIIEFVKIFC